MDDILDDLAHCPCCGSNAATLWRAKALLEPPGWITDCLVCCDSPRVVRHTKADSQKAWNEMCAKRQQQREALERGIENIRKNINDSGMDLS